MKNKTINILFFIFIVFILNPNILERVFYINELFVIFGLYYFLKYFKKYTVNKDIIVRSLIFYNIYCLMYSIVSYFILRTSSNYEFIRTLPIWYCSLTFFLGIEFVKRVNLVRFFSNTGFLSSLIVFAFIIPGRLSNQLILPFMHFNKKLLNFFTLVCCIFFIYKGGATSYVSLISIVSILIIKSPKLVNFVSSKLFISFVFLCFISLLYWINVEFKSFYFDSNYSRFNGFIDNNAIWRLMFWSHQLDINIQSNPFFGIGFGTPLFDLSHVPSFLTSDDGSRATPFTLGTHNSLIFILIRLGIVGLIPIVFIYSNLIRKYIQSPNMKLQTACFFMFLFISINMLFNVIMETPLYGGIFWITLGMFYKSLKIKERSIFYEKKKNTMSSPSTSPVAWS